MVFHSIRIIVFLNFVGMYLAKLLQLPVGKQVKKKELSKKLRKENEAKNKIKKNEQKQICFPKVKSLEEIDERIQKEGPRKTVTMCSSPHSF